MHSHQKRPLVGVIDIGSNSVRLVIYDGLKRVPRPLFNEKNPCGLGHGITQTGRLQEDAKELARGSVTRFCHLAKLIGLRDIYAVATAAIRDAEDGREFIQTLEQENRISIKIISGEREAYLAAQGIFASMHKPKGLAGDLGGGSLELVELSSGVISHQTTLQAGTLRLLDACGDDPDDIRKHVRKILEKTEWLHDGYKRFYAIGGGFRSIARVHMRAHKYPLSLVHHYTLDSDMMFSFLSHLLAMKPDKRESLDGLSKRRIEGFVPSIIALEEILRITGAEQVVFSYAGIREGLLYDKLSPNEHDTDVLTASLSNLMGKETLDNDYTHALFDWQQPLFADEKKWQRRLRKASCLTSEIALPVSSDFRGQWAFEHILQASLYGLTHRERVMLALSLYFRYRKTFRMDESFLALVEEQDILWAQLAGTAADIAFMLSAGTAVFLDQVHLEVDGDEAYLTGDPTALSMVPAAVEKRMEGLGEIFKAYLSCER